MFVLINYFLPSLFAINYVLSYDVLLYYVRRSFHFPIFSDIIFIIIIIIIGFYNNDERMHGVHAYITVCV